MHALREGFGQPVGERFEHDAAVVIVGCLEPRHVLLDADPGGDGERPDVVGAAALRRSDEVRQTQLRLILRLRLLLTQMMQTQGYRLAPLIRVHLDVIVAYAVGGKKSDHCTRLQPFLRDQALEHALCIRIQIGWQPRR